ncbi:TetR-like C-terminal domain-containing protein [Solibacillus sp.]|uniref:TetR-like C-terminal domain-containing protein n=1 Tax=Solibacillus sp. TaxID=1909654 RepID=UPI003314BFD3
MKTSRTLNCAVSFLVLMLQVDQTIVAWYGVSALFGTIIMWAQSDFNYSPEQLANAIVRLAPQEE